LIFLLTLLTYLDFPSLPLSLSYNDLYLVSLLGFLYWCWFLMKSNDSSFILTSFNISMFDLFSSGRGDWCLVLWTLSSGAPLFSYHWMMLSSSDELSL
jgi:hypothetical protein